MDVVKKIEAQNSTPPKKACVIEDSKVITGAVGIQDDSSNQ